MGTFTIELDSEKLKNIVKRADRICGTLEPSTRKLTFFTQEGKLYVLASDGCFKGYFELAPYLFSKAFPPFEILLDVVKQFSTELVGRVNLLFQDNTITFKCQNEILRLKVNYVGKEIRIPHLYDSMIKLSKKKFLNELDFVSCFLEEGSYANLFLTSNSVEFISHHMGIVAYVKSKVEKLPEEENLKFDKTSISIPYVSARHIVKTIDTEETEELKIHFAEGEQQLIIQSTNFYTSCGDLPEDNPDKIRNLCQMFDVKSRVNTTQLQKLLRRSLISGRFSDAQLYTRNGELIVVSQSGAIAYKGSIELESTVPFSVKTKAHLLRSVLARIGSQNILIDVIQDYVVLSSPSLSRFLILRNDRIQ